MSVVPILPPINGETTTDTTQEVTEKVIDPTILENLGWLQYMPEQKHTC